jgi:hypothetical protein
MSAESHNSVNIVAGGIAIGREFSTKVAIAEDKTRRVLAKKMGPPCGAAKMHGSESRNIGRCAAFLSQWNNGCVNIPDIGRRPAASRVEPWWSSGQWSAAASSPQPSPIRQAHRRPQRGEGDGEQAPSTVACQGSRECALKVPMRERLSLGFSRNDGHKGHTEFRNRAEGVGGVQSAAGSWNQSPVTRNK